MSLLLLSRESTNLVISLFISNSFQITAGERAFHFAIQNDLEQLAQLPTRILDRLGDEPKILDLFLTSKILLLILLNSFLLWVPPITFLSLYPIQSLQVFRRKELLLLKGNVCWWNLRSFFFKFPVE